MSQKRLLLLGGIRYLLPVIKAAQEMGVYVITVDYLPDNIAHKFSDEYVNVSIIDREAVLKVAREKKVDGIMSFGVDPGVEVAAWVAEQLGLPTPPYASVHILQNKDLFRDFLRDHGFNCPFHFSYSSKEEALSDERLRQKVIVEKIPVIIKPVDSAGSKGCSKYDPNSPSAPTPNTYTLSDAIDYARAESHSGRFIIEQFLTQVGSSSDTDSFSIDSELVFCSFNCQHFDAASANPYTPAAYSWPSDMPAMAQQELRGEIQRLIKLLNLGTSIYNIETRVATDGKPYIMELSPRGGGNRLSEVLKMATGQDLIKASVLGALGLPIPESVLRIPATHSSVVAYDGFWAEVIVHGNQNGTYEGLEISPKFKQDHVIQEDLWVEKGDAIEEFSGANKAIGTLVLRFASHDEAEKALDSVGAWLSVRVAK